MNCFQSKIDALRHGIAKAIPGVIVNRSLIDHCDLRRDELLAGVITILVESIRIRDDWCSSLRILITGQLEVEQPRDMETIGEVVELAELALFARLRAFLRNTGGLPRVELDTVEFSAQSKVPYGWFLLRINYGPIAETAMNLDLNGQESVPEMMYPPNVLVTNLASVNAHIDVKPHENAVEHEKWLEGDFANSTPEASFDVNYEVKNGKNTETT